MVQEADAVRIGARRVLAGFVEVLISNGIRAFRPIGPHQDPRAGGNTAVLFFPGGDMAEGEKEIGVGARFGAAVDHAGRSNKMLDRQHIKRIVRAVAAGNPVDRRVEMRAGVLAEAHIVPVLSRPAIVVA